MGRFIPRSYNIDYGVKMYILYNVLSEQTQSEKPRGSQICPVYIHVQMPPAKDPAV